MGAFPVYCCYVLTKFPLAAAELNPVSLTFYWSVRAELLLSDGQNTTRPFLLLGNLAMQTRNSMGNFLWIIGPE